MPDWGAILGDMTAAQLVLWVVAILLVGGAIVKGWPLIRDSVKIADALLKLPDLAKRVEDIHHETHKNNGTSIKDAVERVEESLEGIHGRLDQLTTVDKEQRELFDRHLEWANDAVRELKKENK